MNFSCARCGQKYSSSDEPRPGTGYRIPCLVCGGAVLLEGADFPALPTLAADPNSAPGRGDALHAATEEPLVLALAPLAQQEPPALPPQRPSWTVPRARVAPARRRRQVAIAAFAVAAVAAATAGAGALLLLGGPGSDRPVVAPKPMLPPPSKAALASSPPKLPPPVARRAPGSPGPVPVPTGLAAAPAATANERTPAAPARSMPEQMVTDALTARRPALKACLQESLQDEPGLGAAGRRVDLFLTVNPSGIVTSAKLDDPVLEDTALGGCIRNVARTLVLPMFEGEPFQVRIPLTLGD